MKISSEAMVTKVTLVLWNKALIWRLVISGDEESKGSNKDKLISHDYNYTEISILTSHFLSTNPFGKS